MKVIKKRRIYGWLVVIFFLLSFGSSASANEYHIGYQKLDLVSKETDENIPVSIVYPTKIPAVPVRFGLFELDLAIAAPIVSGHFPLVVISHGSGGTNLGHRSIAFELVKKGFVVAMPLHPKNNYKDNSAEGTGKNWINRPKHIKAVIDSIAENEKFSSNVDTKSVAVIGHSAGGYTALAVAGGVANTKHLYQLCIDAPKENEVFCGIGGAIPEKVISEEIKNPVDPRVKAIVLMAPVGVMYKSENALENVDATMLLLSAEKDTQLIEANHADLIARNYKHKNKLTYRTIKNAGHYSFITPFPESMKGSLGEVGEDPEGFDRSAFHKTLSKEIADFIVKVFKGK